MRKALLVVPILMMVGCSTLDKARHNASVGFDKAHHNAKEGLLIVEGYFDSTKDPTKFDLATELAKLDKLKKDGLISTEDYEVLKKKAIEKAKE